MNCPYCQSPVDESTGLCTGCGARIIKQPSGTRSAEPARQNVRSAAPDMAKTVSNTGVLLGKAAREARMKNAVESGELISDRVYNGVIIGVLLWGLLVNYVLCALFSESILGVNPAVLLIGYLVMAIVGTIVTLHSDNPVVSFLGYNLVVVPFGLVISTAVEAYGGISSNAVTQAFLYTMIIAVAMGATAIVFPQFFEKIGTALGAVLIALLCI